MDDATKDPSWRTFLSPKVFVEKQKMVDAAKLAVNFC